MVKTKFWQRHVADGLNDRQQLVINKMFGSFYGKLTRDKYCKMMKVSTDTGSRDIKKMLDLGILSKYPGGGRSTSYYLTALGPTKEDGLEKGKGYE